MFDTFLQSCFLPDGTFNLLYQYPAVTGKNNYNCRFCEFSNDEVNCPKANRSENI